MKNITYILGLLILSGIIYSCNKDVLENDALDFLTPQNAYVDVNGVEQGIAGLYSDIRQRWFSHDGSTSGLFGLGADVGYDGESPGGQRFLTNYITSIRPEQSNIRVWWRQFFAQIQYANNIIEGINNLDENTISPARKNALLAEARFLRAWVYRIVVTLWGDVPLITDPIRGVKTDFVRTPKDEVYDQIESDLIFATENLPVPGSEQAPGRVTQGAAWHLLGDVYLARDKNQLAVDATSKVIDGYGYALMTERFGAQNDYLGSGDVYYDLFRYDNQNASENTETIWAIQFEPNTEGGGGNYWHGDFSSRYFSWGSTPDGYPAFEKASDTLGRPVARIRGTNLVFYGVWQSDWNTDIRNAPHNIKRHFYYNSPGSAFDGKEIKSSLYPPGSRNLWKDTINYIYPYFMKMYSPVYQVQVLGINPNQGGGGEVYTDFYAMRLAETYLLRAEAYLKLGNMQKAADDINVVRNRAHATPVMPDNVDLDYLLDERIRELYGEEFRYIILMRMGKLIERTRKYHDNPFQPGANIQDYNNLWPIPQDQLDLNNNAEFKQNPGY